MTPKTITKDPESWPEEDQEFITCYHSVFADYILLRSGDEITDIETTADPMPIQDFIGRQYITFKDLLPLFKGEMVLVSREDLRQAHFALEYSREFFSKSHKEPHIEKAIGILEALLKENGNG
jgi:hypothetical protein